MADVTPPGGTSGSRGAPGENGGVLGAVLAGIYNLAVKVTGGLLVGFTSN